MTSLTDRARLMLAPVKHLIDFVTPQVDKFLEELEELELYYEARLYDDD